MIDKDSLNIDWIKEVSSKNRKADPQLVEKVIRALMLLEGLVESQLDFVFKGGTALMLKLDSTKRLSIDIDIIVPNIDDSLDVKLKGFLEAKGFTKVELHERNAYSEIEKAHYKFFYTPIHQSGRTEDNILLDILFEKVQYEKIEMIDIGPHIKQEYSVTHPCLPRFRHKLSQEGIFSLYTRFPSLEGQGWVRVI